MEYVSGIFAALSDPIRLRCLTLLVRRGELCACELTYALQAGQPQISKHMALLRDVGLVKDRRDAQWVLYSIAPDLPDWVAGALSSAVQGVLQTDLHAEDVLRLQGMTARPARQRTA